MNKALLIVVLALFIISGCSNNPKSDDDKSYIYTVTIEDNIYGFTGVQVPKEQIGEKIGIEPIACSVSECKAPPGDVFNKIKGSKSKETVAVVSYDEKAYYRWARIS